MAYFFTPPTVNEGPAGGARLFYFYTIPRGDSLLKQGFGSYIQLRTPSQDAWREYEIVYQGGHVYEISSDEKASLEAAGYGPLITETA